MDFKILIVDDYVDLHRVLSLAVKSFVARRINPSLGAQGADSAAAPPIRAEFASAFHGSEAIDMTLEAKSKERPYDLVFMDILMPGGDGLSTAKKVLDICPKTEVIFVTAHSNYSWQDIVDFVGSEEYISIVFKPFELEKLGDHVTSVIKRVLARKGHALACAD